MTAVTISGTFGRNERPSNGLEEAEAGVPAATFSGGAE